MEKLGIECKKLMAREIKEKIKSSPTLFVTSFNALAVSEQEQLRRRLKEINASVFVVKNRIAKKTFKELGQELVASLLQGPASITCGGGDSVLVSKTLVDFAGKHEDFKILGAYVEEQLLDTNLIKRLASIPSKEVLFTQIVTAINFPVQGLVNTLSAMLKKFVLVVDRIREKKG